MKDFAIKVGIITLVGTTIWAEIANTAVGQVVTDESTVAVRSTE